MRPSNVVASTDRARLGALVLVLLAALLGACSNDDDPYADSPSRPSAADYRAMEQKVLDQRARAVRKDNLRLFLRTLDKRNKGLLARQKRWFDNVTQLPLQRLGYRVEDAAWPMPQVRPRWGRDVRVPQINMVMQLQGYDDVPVRRTVGFAFSFDRARPRIVSDTTGTGAPLINGDPSPWDLTSITVRQSGGVLGVFDSTTAPTAGLVTGVVQQGMAALDRALPFSWDNRVVVYDLADKTVLSSFRDVPGGNITKLGALSFPVRARADGGPVASTRMMLLPSSVQAGEPFLGRITRHELSHVAIGPRDDGAPVWLSEGIAEYLGARGLPRSRQIIPTSAVSRAQLGEGGMPRSAGFNGTDQDWHYALAWMACDYLAATQGEDVLWRLMDAMHAGGKGTPDRLQDRVLLSVTGMDSRELARKAAARIRAIYG